MPYQMGAAQILARSIARIKAARSAANPTIENDQPQQKDAIEYNKAWVEVPEPPPPRCEYDVD